MPLRLLSERYTITAKVPFSSALISASDVSVSVKIPTALWHSVWTDYSPDFKDYVATASSLDGTKLVAATRYSGGPGSIWTSTDSGVTWVERTSAGKHPWSHLASSSDGMKLAATAFTNTGGDYIYTSTDAGLTWTAQGAPGRREWSVIASSADGTKVVVYDDISGYIQISTDAGVTWTKSPGFQKNTCYPLPAPPTGQSSSQAVSTITCIQAANRRAFVLSACRIDR